MTSSFVVDVVCDVMCVLQVTKSEGGSSAAGDSAESLAEDLLKRFSDSQPDIKKEPITSKFCICICDLFGTGTHTRITHHRKPILFEMLTVFFFCIFYHNIVIVRTRS